MMWRTMDHFNRVKIKYARASRDYKPSVAAAD